MWHAQFIYGIWHVILSVILFREYLGMIVLQSKGTRCYGHATTRVNLENVTLRE